MVSPSVGASAAHTLHRNGAERHGRGEFRGKAGGHADRQIDRHVDDLGMVGDAGAGAGDEVAALERLDLAAELDDFARGRIADRQARAEPAPDDVERTLDALVAP